VYEIQWAATTGVFSVLMMCSSFKYDHAWIACIYFSKTDGLVIWQM